MELRNYTPHPVIVIGDDGRVVATYPVQGPIPRVKEIVVPDRHIDGVLVNKVSYDEEVTDLPAPEKGVLLIVSRITAGAVSGRDDLFFPHGEVRDEVGRIVGVRALGRF